MHDHPHHDHDHDHEIEEAPLDAANQSLADALRASFGILKAIMFILVGLYLISNVRRIESHEQAVVLRFGELKPTVHEAGLLWAFPFPIEEIVPLPTKQSNELEVKSHTFHRFDTEVGKPLTFITRGPSAGLKPAQDGALLTADAGLVHVEWKVTYKIDDVQAFISNIEGTKLDAASDIMTTMVETCGIELASELTADELIRTRVDYVQGEMRERVNRKLSAANTGISVIRMQMVDPTPPISVRGAFDDTQRAENSRVKKINEAEQERVAILSQAAGEVYQEVLDLIEKSEDESLSAKERSAAEKELDALLVERVEGNAGRMIKDAGAYLSKVVGQMQSDVELYRTLLPEYQRNPDLLIARLWEETRQRLFASTGVQKIFRPVGSQFRVTIPLDPQEERRQEERRLQGEKSDLDSLRTQRFVPVGPEAD